MHLLLAAAAFAAEPAAHAHLYVGATLPVTGGGLSSTGESLVQLDLAPLVAEWRFAPTWGLRLDADADYSFSSRRRGWDGGRVRLEGVHYFGATARSEGMRGFYLGPTAGFTFSVAGEAEPLAGFSLGYSGALGADLRWRMGVAASAVFTEQGPAADYRVTLFEIGGFVF